MKPKKLAGRLRPPGSQVRVEMKETGQGWRGKLLSKQAGQVFAGSFHDLNLGDGRKGSIEIVEVACCQKEAKFVGIGSLVRT